MIIIWSDLALIRLREIALYYKRERSQRVARKVISQIKQTTNALRRNPNMAVVEPLLSDYPEDYRSLIVSKNFKVVYYIDVDIIRIITVFDCRQDPEKLQREIGL